MASTSSNKRPRTSSSSPKPQDSAPRQPRYDPLFRKTHLSDIILESSQGTHFATSKLHLQSSSLVFRDTLLVGQDQASETLDDLPLIKLEDESLPLSQFLAFVQVEPSVELEKDHTLSLASVPRLDAVLSLCDKYHAPLVGRSIVTFAFSRIIEDLEAPGSHIMRDLGPPDDNLINFIALALIWSQYQPDFWVRKMIAMMGVRGVVDEEVIAPMKEYTLKGVLDAGRPKQLGWRPLGIQDIKIDLLRTMAAENVSRLASVIMGVLIEEMMDWDDASYRFEIYR